MKFLNYFHIYTIVLISIPFFLVVYLQSIKLIYQKKNQQVNTSQMLIFNFFNSVYRPSKSMTCNSFKEYIALLLEIDLKKFTLGNNQAPSPEQNSTRWNCFLFPPYRFSPFQREFTNYQVLQKYFLYPYQVWAQTSWKQSKRKTCLLFL